MSPSLFSCLRLDNQRMVDKGLTLILFLVPESLRYLSMYDNRILRYFKGHKDRSDITIGYMFTYLH